tara:strand:+ start:251 stop:535 length:285 start_codon:yes stop_codon:yes gene_type:complete
MTGLNEKEKEIVSKSQDELRKSREVAELRKYDVMKKAADGPKIRYESRCDPSLFRKYLVGRVQRWEYLSTKGGPGSHHAKRMLDKTNHLISVYE